MVNLRIEATSVFRLRSSVHISKENYVAGNIADNQIYSLHFQWLSVEMKNKLKIFEVIALIIWSVFFAWNNTESNIASDNAKVSIEAEIPSVPQVADLTNHQASDGMVERRVVSGELTDQEKIPAGGLIFSLSASYQNALRFSLLETNSASDFFRERDIPVFYHNLRI